ncbi:MAG: DUF5060 domain-containing protein, partial [Rubrivivax sp.]|nr:DUF5060 domain-containing protein [Rubrivivax sp.]
RAGRGFLVAAGLAALVACGGSGGDSSLDPPPSSPPPAPPPAIAVSVADASVQEGPTRALVFAATLTAPAAEVVRLGYVVREGTARSGRDYIDTSGPIEFAPGQTRVELTVPVIDDPLHEGREALRVELTDLPAGVLPGTLAASGTIEDDEVARRHERVEIELDLGTNYANPFDPDEVELDVHLTRPDGSAVVIPAFYYRDLEIVGIAPERYGRGSAPSWRARFAPTHAGAHSLRAFVKDASGSRALGPAVPFAVLDGPARGAVRIDSRDGRFLRHDDGTPFVPVGHNVAWEDGTGLGTVFWERTFSRMAMAGENWTRVHQVHYHDGQSLEWTPNHTGYYQGLGRYSLELAWKLDRVVEAAERHGIAMQFVILNNVILNTRTTPQWDGNPYNVRNAGGFLERPEQFFSDPHARKLFKRQLRYLVARYAYSSAILCWELVNETYLVDGFATSAQVRADVIDWHREMSEYLHAIDPARHLVTTGSAEEPQLDALWSLPSIDLIQFHNYRPRQIAAFASDIARLRSLGKPILMGEFGVEDQVAETRVDSLPEPERTQLREALPLHNGIWAASMMNSGAMLWWWDRYIDALDLYGRFTPLARFWAGEDPAARGLAAAPVAVRGGPRGTRVTATPGITDFWTASAQRSFTVAADGTVPGIEGLSVWLHGAGHAARRSDPAFTVTLASAGHFRVAVQEVSPYSAAIEVLVDGTSAFTASYAGGEPPFEIAVPMAAGTHTVQLVNTGNDYLKIDRLHFDGVDAPMLTVIGQLGPGGGYLWVWDRRSDYHQSGHGVVVGASLAITGLADGPYEIEIWPTWTVGGPLAVRQASSSQGALDLALPDFTRDLALKVRSRQPTAMSPARPPIE